MKVTRIVVPIDFSADSQAALEWAVDLTSTFGPPIDLIHVVENPMAAGVWSSPMYRIELEGLHINLVREAERQLHALMPSAAGERCSVNRAVRIGDPSREIVAFAADRGADLIVMGTRGRTGLPHVLLGSVAEKVSRAAHCPVVTVKSPLAYEKLRASDTMSCDVPA